MKFSELVERIKARGLKPAAQKREPGPPTTLVSAKQLASGVFHFKMAMAKRAEYEIRASTDLLTWIQVARNVARETGLEFVDSDAARLGRRFYRVIADTVPSTNLVGFVSMSLPPGFSMVANPLDTPGQTVGELFSGWPDGTTLNKFEAIAGQLSNNAVTAGAWVNPAEELQPGEGAIIFNPASRQKTVNFVGNVRLSGLPLTIPAGFSVCSSRLPRAGQLHEDLGFPIAEGDVIHLFDRDRQKYVLHTFEQGKWKNGSPGVSIGESFWVAKAVLAEWTQVLAVDAELLGDPVATA